MTLFATIVILGAVALLVRGLFFGYPPARLDEGALLTRKEQAIIAAIADALFPPSGPIPVSGTEAGLVAYIDGHVRGVQTHTRFLMRLLFVFLEHGSWVFGPSRRFTRLSQEERIQALDAMSTSSIYFRRVAFLSIRTMMCMGYLANAEVKRAIGLEYRMAPFEVPSSSNAPMSAREVLA